MSKMTKVRHAGAHFFHFPQWRWECGWSFLRWRQASPACFAAATRTAYGVLAERVLPHSPNAYSRTPSAEEVRAATYPRRAPPQHRDSAPPEAHSSSVEHRHRSVSWSTDFICWRRAILASSAVIFSCDMARQRRDGGVPSGKPLASVRISLRPNPAA